MIVTALAREYNTRYYERHKPSLGTGDSLETTYILPRYCYKKEKAVYSLIYPIKRGVLQWASPVATHAMRRR